MSSRNALIRDLNIIQNKYMKFQRIIFLLPLLCTPLAYAQLPQEETVSTPDQWELTLDVIKSKAQSLMLENNGLQDQYHQLISQLQELEQAIYDQQYKNNQLEYFIKDRHGRSDQQMQLDELTQVLKAKKLKAQLIEEDLDNLKEKQAKLNANIQQLKYMISDLELREQAQRQKAQQEALKVQAAAKIDQLAPWRQQLEDENKQEVLLQNQLNTLKTGDKTQQLNVDAIFEENKQLAARLDFLRLQKMHHLTSSPKEEQSSINAKRYIELKMRKEELVADINAYELRLDQLRGTSILSLSWPVQKKRLVHDMVRLDNRNNQMKENIKVLQEDIEVLRDEVSRLERRLNFARGNT